MVSAHDLAEIARSASEASKIKLLDVDLTRYLAPSPETYYPLEYAFHLLGDVREKLIVDLGCGSGENVVPLCQRGARVIGIDISPDLIAIAQQRLRKYGTEAELRVGSAYDTGLPDESCDVVFCMSVLHHLQLDRVKAEIRRILKPDGVVIVKEPVRFSWTVKQLRRLFPSGEDVSPFEYPLNSKQLRELAEGFKLLASRNFETPLVGLNTRIIKSDSLKKQLRSLDCWMLKYLPGAAHFTTIRVMSLGNDQSGGRFASTK